MEEWLWRFTTGGIVIMVMMILLMIVDGLMRGVT